MEIVEITAYNLERYIVILGAEMAENIGRDGYTAISAIDKDENALVWKVVKSVETGRTMAEILLFRAGNKRGGKQLLLEFVRRNSMGGVRQFHFCFDSL